MRQEFLPPFPHLLMRRRPPRWQGGMANSAKERLDILLFQRGLADSREKAQALIMAGLVFSGDQKFTKAGHKIDCTAELMVKGKDHPYVSRGGVKLAGGLDHFTDIDPKGMVAIDV